MRLDSGLPLSSAGIRESKEPRWKSETRAVNRSDREASIFSPTFLRRMNRWGSSWLLVRWKFHSDATLVKGHSAPLLYASTHLSEQEPVEGRLRGKKWTIWSLSPLPSLLPLTSPCSSLIFPSPPCFFFPPVPSLSLSLVCSLAASPPFPPCALNTNIPCLLSLPVLKTYWCMWGVYRREEREVVSECFSCWLLSVLVGNGLWISSWILFGPIRAVIR